MKEIKIANILKSEGHTQYIAHEQKANILELGSFVWIKDKYNTSIGIIVDSQLYNPIMMGFSSQQEQLEYYIPDHQLDSDHHLIIQLIGYKNNNTKLLSQNIPKHKHILGAGVYEMSVEDMLNFHIPEKELSLHYLQYLNDISPTIKKSIKNNIKEKLEEQLSPTDKRLIDVIFGLEII